MTIKDLKPELLWKHFYALTQIPRPSHHEEKAVAYVINFALAHKLEYIQDATGNVIIRKPATPGFESRKTVTLQGHLDIVPQKNSGIEHNFVTDPLNVYIEGDWLTAKDTTLGSDNGIGVAAALAVLEAKDLKHGPIEALFTINEEAGMEGAFGLETNTLQGDILLNLDSEDEGELYVGCAGGINVSGTFQNITEPMPEDFKCYELSVRGLKGGHSGLDINLERGNANKLIFRILKSLVKEDLARVVSLNCGSLRNAIPREAFVVLAINPSDIDKISVIVSKFQSVLTKELSNTEPKLNISISACEQSQNLMNQMVQDDLINAVTACPNGVAHMSTDMEGVVETSNNLAIVKSDDEKIELIHLVRSSVDSRKYALASEIESVLALAGAKVTYGGDYPGWKPNPKSEILQTMLSVYEKNWHKTPAIKAIHAGLECGIIGANYPNLDMISFGPTIRFPHSPDEKVHIASVGEFWKWLILTLENIPSK